MAITKLSDVINPQVMGDMIEAKITAQAKITPYAKVDTTLQGVPGDTKTVPSWNYIGDAEDFDPENGNELDTTNLTASSTTFTIKCAAKSVGIYQTAINSGLGNPIGQAETQLAKSIVGKVDNDVIDAAYTCANTYDGTGEVIGYNATVDAVAKFEDEEDGIDKVMFIHPQQEATLLKDSNFLSADKFQAGVAVNGAIGKIAGCWIKKSKKVKHIDITQGVRTITVTTAATKNKEFAVTIDGKTYAVTDDTSTTTTSTTAGKIQAALAADTTARFTATVASAVITLTEKADAYGLALADAPVINAKESSVAATLAETTDGVAGFKCPIIKMEADSTDTEYTEDELPAVTIFLKKETQVDHEWLPKKQKHDVTAAKYYGVALTNAAKVVVAKFKK